MATEHDKDTIKDHLQELLSATRFACTSLDRLGGYLGFVYRGTLCRPLANGAGTVIIKHTTSYAARMTQHQPSENRGARENEILVALARRTPTPVPPVTVGSITVRTAQVYDFLPQATTALIEDIAGSITLLALFKTLSWRHLLAPARSALGFGLGAWLGNFHSSAGLDRATLPQIAASSDNGRRSIWEFNERNLQQNLEAYPGLWGTEGGTRVRALVEAELRRNHGCDLGVTHGDFHVMNVLLSSGFFASTIVPIDWETCHFGCQTLDFAQMISNLYIVDRVGGINGPMKVMKGFVDGYHDTRRLDAELVWHTVVGVGALLLCAPYGLVLPGRDVREILKVGEDLLTRGAAKDREWLATCMLGCLLDKI